MAKKHNFSWIFIIGLTVGVISSSNLKGQPRSLHKHLRTVHKKSKKNRKSKVKKRRKKIRRHTVLRKVNAVKSQVKKKLAPKNTRQKRKKEVSLKKKSQPVRTNKVHVPQRVESLKKQPAAESTTKKYVQTQAQSKSSAPTCYSQNIQAYGVQPTVESSSQSEPIQTSTTHESLQSHDQGDQQQAEQEQQPRWYDRAREHAQNVGQGVQRTVRTAWQVGRQEYQHYQQERRARLQEEREAYEAWLREQERQQIRRQERILRAEQRRREREAVERAFREQQEHERQEHERRRQEQEAQHRQLQEQQRAQEAQRRAQQVNAGVRQVYQRIVDELTYLIVLQKAFDHSKGFIATTENQYNHIFKDTISQQWHQIKQFTPRLPASDNQAILEAREQLCRLVGRRFNLRVVPQEQIKDDNCFCLVHLKEMPEDVETAEDAVVVVLPCTADNPVQQQHQYHKCCIEEWLKRDPICPADRLPVGSGVPDIHELEQIKTLFDVAGLQGNQQGARAKLNNFLHSQEISQIIQAQRAIQEGDQTIDGWIAGVLEAVFLAQG